MSKQVSSVTSPSEGVFFAAAPETVTCEGELIRAGQVIGEVVATGHRHAIVADTQGMLEGILESGESVSSGDPVAWLRVLHPNATASP